MSNHVTKLCFGSYFYPIFCVFPLWLSVVFGDLTWDRLLFWELSPVWAEIGKFKACALRKRFECRLSMELEDKLESVNKEQPQGHDEL
ncbi:hypothetical protein QVD17_37604 [Tagetes erecta]|uniref:Uncharacterized protein n=1 Tax=Tagetes erecta TaxID=13708 RepID=A0AAD8NCU7_TARER|nr:hypothetical protein QVD17_37604 [Tagetes erecta]